MNNKKLVAILALTGAVANLGLATAFAQATGSQTIDCQAAFYTVQHRVKYAETPDQELVLGNLTALTFETRDIRFLDTSNANTPARVISLLHSGSGTPVPVPASPTPFPGSIAIVSNITAPADLTGTGCPPAAHAAQVYTTTVSSTGLYEGFVTPGPGDGNKISVLLLDPALAACAVTACDLTLTSPVYSSPSINFVENTAQTILNIPIQDGFSAYYTAGATTPLHAVTHLGDINFQVAPLTF